MRNLWLFVISAAMAAAQSNVDSVTVTAQRSIPVQPDEFVIGLVVDSGFNKGLDDVVAPLAAVGITAVNLSSVNNYAGDKLQWAFVLDIPTAKVNGTLAALNTVRQNLMKTSPDVSFAYFLQGTQVSPELAAAQACPLSELISDARAQAQKLVSASPGLSVGPIVALSDGSSRAVADPAIFATIPATRVPISVLNPLSPTIGLSLIDAITPASTLACTLVVKFRLVRYQ